jgi:hypothetical protein
MPNDTDQKVAAEKDQKGHKPVKFQIQIDRVHYTVTQEFMTGAELRRVPPTPIPADRDLFEVVPGAPDWKIGDNDTVEMPDGQRFFTSSHLPGTWKKGISSDSALIASSLPGTGYGPNNRS